MKCYNTHEAKSNLSKILLHIEKSGESVQICRNGVPVAELQAVSAQIPDPLKQNKVLKQITVDYDPVAPLEEADWPEINLETS